MAKSRTPRTAARKAAGKRKAARKTARARKTVRKVRRKAAKRRATRTVATRRKAVSKARPRARGSSTARRAVRKAAKSSRRAKATAKRAITKKSKAPATAAPIRVVAAPAPKTPRPTTKPARAARPASARKPALDRERRRLPEASLPPTPPSSLDLDQRASAARSGRREIEEHLSEHTETGPILTAGDVDADWEAAYSSGDEAPGGDNPTPDQDVVDEIGRSLGLEYNDNEELKGADKVEARDRHRWELDPASSEDYDDRE
jgi:Family of unknown function (DUF6335)